MIELVESMATMCSCAALLLTPRRMGESIENAQTRELVAALFTASETLRSAAFHAARVG